MRKSLFHTAFSALTIAFIIIVVGKYVIVAQAPVTGTWTADTRHAGKVGKAYSDGRVGSGPAGRGCPGRPRERRGATIGTRIP